MSDLHFFPFDFNYLYTFNIRWKLYEIIVMKFYVNEIKRTDGIIIGLSPILLKKY